MKNLTLINIANSCGGKLYCGDDNIANTEVSAIVTDNRQVTKDSMFIAIPGAKVDGHDFIEDAYNKGAMAVIAEHELDIDKPYIVVENSLTAIKAIATFYRQQLDIKVVGITGSVGKTSTKETIYSVLSQKYNTLKTNGNFNNELGLPLTIFRLRDEHEIAVLEMGINSFGEMTRLSAIAKPDIAVITNIGLCHLENLKSRDGILKAKTEMFTSLNPNGKIILNGDDDKLSTIQDYNGIKPVFYYVDDVKNKKIYADNISYEGIKETNCDIHYGDEAIKACIHVPGKHMISNALAAVCVAKELGLSKEEIEVGLDSLNTIQGRNNFVNTGYLTVIDDCYNANPVSMKASIDVLNQGNTRRVAILGDMFELGKNEEKYHEEIGQYLIDTDIEVVVFIGSLMKNAFDYLKDNLENTQMKIYYFDELKGFMDIYKNILEKNDLVLVKASHGMEFTKIVDELKEYNI